MKIVKSFVSILYSVNAINHIFANLQSELIILWLLKLHPAGMICLKTKGIENIKPKNDQQSIKFMILPWLTIEYVCDWGTNGSHWVDADYIADFKICDVCWWNISEWLMFYDSSSKCTQIFYWCHLATNTLQQWLTLGIKKMVSSCNFRTALVSALISINFILFDIV